MNKMPRIGAPNSRVVVNLVLTSLLIFLVKCSVPIHTVNHHLDSSFDPSQLRDKCVAVVVQDQGIVALAPDLINTVYGSHRDCAASMGNTFIKSQKALSGEFKAIQPEVTHEWLTDLSLNFDRTRSNWDEPPPRFDELFGSSMRTWNADYLFFITRWNVSSMSNSGSLESDDQTMYIVSLTGGLINSAGETIGFAEVKGEAITKVNAINGVKYAIRLAMMRMVHFLNGAGDHRAIASATRK